MGKRNKRWWNCHRIEKGFGGRRVILFAELAPLSWGLGLTGFFGGDDRLYAINILPFCFGIEHRSKQLARVLNRHG